MFTLRDRLAESMHDEFWSHHSGGEHTLKHYGDIADIEKARVSRGEAPLGNDALYDLMSAHGVLVVRTYLEDGGVGDMAGYGVVDRITTPGEVVLKDLWVEEGHRNRGIGGFILGDLLTNRPYDALLSKQFFGRNLLVGSQRYRLPEIQISLWNLTVKQGEEFKAKMPDNWTGILALNYDDEQDDMLLFDEGVNVCSFEKTLAGVRIFGGGDDKTYDNLAIAAIDALNSP